MNGSCGGPAARSLLHFSRRLAGLGSLLCLGLFLFIAAPLRAVPAFDGLTQALDTGGSITLAAPAAVAVAPDGTVYVADTGNGRIVVTSPQGIASVLAISGLSPALSGPAGLALDSSGTLYIADSGNARVVKVTAAGAGSVVSTGSVTLTAARGVAVDPSGNLFIADGVGGASRIVEVTAGGSAAVVSISVSSGSATLSAPRGLAVDTAGSLYIADSGNGRVVKVPAGSTTGAVVGIGGGITLTTPTGVAVDFAGNLFISDSGSNPNRIAEVDSAGTGSVLATGSVTPSGPLGVALDVLGTVYVADSGNNQCLVVFPAKDGDPANTSSLNKTVVNFGHVQLGDSTGVSLTLPFTLGATAPAGGVKVLTQGVEGRDFTLGADSTLTASTPAAGTGTVQVIFVPTAPGLRQGAVTILDGSGNVLLSVNLAGTADAPLASLGPNSGSVVSTGAVATANPYQAALDASGNIYLAAYSSSAVFRIPAGGGSAAQVVLGTPGTPATTVRNITGVALDGSGNLFIGDHQNSRILVKNLNGVVSVLNITGLSPVLGFPTALAFDASGNLLVEDFTNGRIIQVSNLVVSGSTSTGKATLLRTGSFSFGSGNATGMCVDPFGNIYVAARTQNSSHIIKVTRAGAASVLDTTAVSPAVSNPQGVASDAFGNIYVVDTSNNRIVRVTTAGVCTALSVTGLPSPATTLGPTLFGVTADPAGNLYISDWTNNRLVFVNVSGAILRFNSTNQGATSSDSPKTATVANLGNQPLAFSADPTYTADFSQNGAASNPITSSTVLASGTSGNVPVNFVPQSVGSISATITVTDNTQNVAGSTQQVAVSGIGINPGDTTGTTVAISPASLVRGQAAAITATVTDITHSATTPTGTVSFLDTVGSTLTSLGSATLSGGHATLSGVLLSGIGSHTITANYAGVNGSLLASSGTTTATLAKAAATVAGPASAPQILVGNPATLGVTVTPPYATIAVPSGTVAWSVLNASSTSIASGTATLAATSTAGSANWTVAANLLPTGSYTVTASYSGDANYLASSSPVSYTFQVGQASTTVALTPGNTGITYAGQTCSFTAAVTTSLATAATGTVTFFDGTTALGTVALASGSATFTTSGLATGTHSITASYAGDSANAASVSAALEAVVTAPVVTVPTPTPAAIAGSDGVATTQLTLGSLGPLGAPITFTTTGLPAGASITFDQTAVIVTNAPVVVNVTITTTPRLRIIGRNQGSGEFPFGGFGAGALLGCGILAVPLAGRRRRFGVFLSALALLLAGGMTACTSHNTSKGATTGAAGTPAGTYSVVVTASAQGATPATSTIQLTVN